MIDDRQAAAASDAFGALHRKGVPLVLINVWDVASARAMIDAGALAIATSSGALAASQGFADGEQLPFDDLLRVIERIAALSDVPLTVDVEGGYGATPEAVAANLRRIEETGAVGVNLEDSLRGGQRALLDGTKQAERLKAAREAVPSMFLNARIDAYLLGGTGDDAFSEAVHRAKLYIAAGANGIFVPGIADLTLIQDLADAIDAPLNVLAGPTTPSIADLAAAGVARISLGGWPLVVSLKRFRRDAAALIASGDFSSFD